MLKKVKLAVAAMAVVLAGVMSPATVNAKAVCQAGENKGKVVEVEDCVGSDGKSAADTTLFDRVGTLINVVLSVLGIVAVVVLVIGAVQYMTSTGDAGKTKTAKDTIMYGIIGLVIALLAFAIVNFVLGAIGDTAGGGSAGEETSEAAES